MLIFTRPELLRELQHVEDQPRMVPVFKGRMLTPVRLKEVDQGWVSAIRLESRKSIQDLSNEN